MSSLTLNTVSLLIIYNKSTKNKKSMSVSMQATFFYPVKFINENINYV